MYTVTAQDFKLSHLFDDTHIAITIMHGEKGKEKHNTVCGPWGFRWSHRQALRYIRYFKREPSTLLANYCDVIFMETV